MTTKNGFSVETSWSNSPATNGNNARFQPQLLLRPAKLHERRTLGEHPNDARVQRGGRTRVQTNMPGPPLIVIGASAGGIEALRRLLPQLSEELPAAVAVVVHRQAVADDERLRRVLANGARVPVTHAAHGDPIVPGRVYLAPAGVHLVVHDGEFCLSAGPRENSSRPAIDVLFRSAALAGGDGVAGVLLSGLMHDGVAGLAAIRERGGRVIVQDPADAAYAHLPRSALAALAVDAMLPIDRLGRELTTIATGLAQRVRQRARS